MVKLRKALVVFPDDVPGEIAPVPNSHGYVIYRDEIRAGYPTLVSAVLGAPRAIQDQGGGRADLPSSPRSGKQPDSGDLRGFCSDAGAAGRGRDLFGHPSARVIVHGASGQFSVRISKPAAKEEEVGKRHRVTKEEAAEPGRVTVTKLEGKVDEAFRLSFAQVLAETLVGEIWPAPAPSTEALQDYDTVSQAAEYLLEPETLLLKGINAAARAAAHAATFGWCAPLIGHLAENLCAPLLRPSANSQAAGDMVTAIDIDLYAQDGQLAQCPALHALTVAEAANVIDHWSKSDPGTAIKPVPSRSQSAEPGGREPAPGSQTRIRPAGPTALGERGPGAPGGPPAGYLPRRRRRPASPPPRRPQPGQQPPGPHQGRSQGDGR